MKLEHLNEFDVKIADPKTAYALKKAKAKYSYTRNDVEAFIKMVHDDYLNMQREGNKQNTKINNLERSMDHYKKRIQDITSDIKELQRKLK